MLSDDEGAEAYRIKDRETVQLITKANSQLLDKLVAEETDYIQYPAIQAKGGTGISFVTDELSIKFKDEANEAPTGASFNAKARTMPNLCLDEDRNIASKEMIAYISFLKPSG